MATLHGISYVMCSGAGGKPLIHTDRALGAASGHSLFFGYDGMSLDYFTTAELFYYCRTILLLQTGNWVRPVAIESTFPMIVCVCIGALAYCTCTLTERQQTHT